MVRAPKRVRQGSKRARAGTASLLVLDGRNITFEESVVGILIIVLVVLAIIALLVYIFGRRR